MGMILGVFRKKKESTMEVLEKLEGKIQSIEEFGKHTEQTQKKVVGCFIVISILIYCLVVFAIYLHFFPASAYERFTYMLPLIILPLILMSIKRTVSWYFNRKIRKNHEVVSSLKKEKKKILEDVMDKETYKVAKQILEKFSTENVRKNNELTPFRAPPPGFSPAISRTGPRYRSSALTATAAQNQIKYGPNPTPLQSRFQNITPSAITPRHIQTPAVILPRAILPRERSVLDKMVDYLVGDGPSNRYALICHACSSHNGMAVKEEFDYLSFKCCYCSTFNPARKQRPSAPKLEFSGPVVDTASSESSSSNDEDEIMSNNSQDEAEVTKNDNLSDEESKSGPEEEYKEDGAQEEAKSTED